VRSADLKPSWALGFSCAFNHRRQFGKGLVFHVRPSQIPVRKALRSGQLFALAGNLAGLRVGVRPCRVRTVCWRAHKGRVLTYSTVKFFEVSSESMKFPSYPPHRHRTRRPACSKDVGDGKFYLSLKFGGRVEYRNGKCSPGATRCPNHNSEVLRNA
jgi:hypothetical protein